MGTSLPKSTFIQVTPDSSGKRVHNLLLQGVVQADGTVVDAYIQALAVIDERGRVIDFDKQEHDDAVLTRLDTIIELLQQLASE